MWKLVAKQDWIALESLRDGVAELTGRLNKLDAAILAVQSEASEGMAKLEVAVEASRLDAWHALGRLTEELVGLQPLHGTVAELRSHTTDLNVSVIDDLVAIRQENVNVIGRLTSTLDNTRVEVANAIGETQGTLGSRLNEIETSIIERVGGVESRLNEVEGALAEQTNVLDNNVGLVRTKLNEVETLVAETGNHILSRFNQLFNVALPDLSGEIHESAAVALAAYSRERLKDSYGGARPKPDPALTMEAALKRAGSDHPHLFPLWRSRLDTMEAAFKETKVGNAAHVGDTYSRLFRLFVERLGRGQFLDIGCGPFGVPFYLAGLQKSTLSGIEPLSFAPEPDFLCVRGISEYLPWPDRVFDTVISATSLDHCLSLVGSLKEMTRVLAPGGRVLLWIGSNPGSPAFEPSSPDFVPADRFHLFHFDTLWFEPMLEKFFAVQEKQEYKRPGYSHVFYSLAHAGTDTIGPTHDR